MFRVLTAESSLDDRVDLSYLGNGHPSARHVQLDQFACQVLDNVDSPAPRSPSASVSDSFFEQPLAVNCQPFDLTRTEPPCPLSEQVLRAETDVMSSAFVNAVGQFQSLLASPAGCLLAEKVVSLATPAQINHIVYVLERRFVSWCRETTATVPLQRLICRVSDSASRDRLLRTVEPEINSLIIDFQANLILQQMIVSWPVEDLGFILDSVVR